MMRRISRRDLLGRAGVAAIGTTGLAVLADTAHAETRVLYLLDPGACGSGGCSACRACGLHAANSYFPSADAADLHRAHPYCNCLVKAGPTVPDDTYLTLFGAPTASARARVDLRMRWVQDALSQVHVPSPTDSTNTPAGPSLLPAPDASPLQPPAPLAPVNPRHPSSQTPLRVGFRVEHAAPRRLKLLIRVDHSAHVHAQLLTTGGYPLTRRAFRASAGRTAHSFHIPNGVPPGVYRLHVTLQAEESGTRHTLERPITITVAKKMPHTRDRKGHAENLSDTPE